MTPNTYTITYDDGKACRSQQVPRPERSPEPGEEYEFTTPALTLAGVRYEPGDKLFLVERTNKAPHHLMSSLGNWVVKCKHFTSVWSGIEWNIANEYIKLVEK